MYKSNFKKLTVGQQVLLKVIESSDGIIIISFQGQLLRVSNKTEKKFKEGDQIRLQVKRINPIEFAFNSGNGFNVYV